jgi:hypothetical protein
MKTMITRILLALTVAAGLSWVTVPPASAHNEDVYDAAAALACGATRPDSSYHFGSANPYYFDSYHIRESCILHSHSQDVVCSWTAIYWLPSGPITGPYNVSCAPIWPPIP